MKFYVSLLSLFIPLLTQAHYIPAKDTPITINASLAATWRSNNTVAEYEYWQIPGTNMGGDAWPVEEGVQVDEIKLGLGVRIDNSSYAIIEVGTHASGSEDHNSVSLEHAYIGFACCEALGPLLLEVGKMSAAFSPSLSSHAADRLTSETSLAADVFFGRYFHDEGARIMWHTDSLIAGIEGWKGNAFPATASTDIAWDAFARYQWTGNNVSLSSGAWLYHSSARARADHRYSGSHQHTPVSAPGEMVSIFPDTRFTGDTDVYGIHADVAYASDNKQWKTGLKAEYMSMRMEGTLHDAIGRAADVDSNQTGAWAQTYIEVNDHTLGIRAEWLTSDNLITGAAANPLSADSGIANSTRLEPSRYTAIWVWQWKEDIALRTEVVDDQSLPEDNLRFGIGIIWKQTLWPFNGKSHH